MKTQLYNFFALILLIFLGSSVNAEDLRKIVSLSGNWKFSIGNDDKWSSPGFNDSDWDQINVPGKWEDQGNLLITTLCFIK